MKNDITIIIKTFNRKQALIRLLKSIERYYNELSIIIVDDSKRNYKKKILSRFKNLKIKYLVEDYDIGLSKGRNILIKNVKTNYFLLCDDDFEFDERTNIGESLKIMKQNGYDILGGNVYNRIYIDSIYSFLWTIKSKARLKSVLQKQEIVSIYNGNYKIKDKNIFLDIDNDINNYKSDCIYKTDICSNFFIGKTKKIIDIGGWTPELLKVGEHEFFFLKAKLNNLNVAYTPNFGIVHYPKKTLNYYKFRGRANELFKQACIEQNINSFIVNVKGKYKYYFKVVKKK